MSDPRSRPHRATDRPPGTETDPWAEDARLWGRTYAIPFARVWKAARTLADGGLSGWSLGRADDREGIIEAASLTWPRKQRDDVRIAIRLDENAQTRVDLLCRRSEGDARRRRHPRLIGRFLVKLDRALEATSRQKLDPTSTPSWVRSDTS